MLFCLSNCFAGIQEDSWDKDKAQIDKDIWAKELNMLNKIPSSGKECGGYESVFEKFSHNPQGYFMFKVGDRIVIGRKYLSDLVLHRELPEIFCCKISSDMILGFFKNIRISEEGIEFGYIACSLAEKRKYFSQLLNDPNIEIHYPAVQLPGKEKNEKVTPDCGWVVDKERAEFLSIGEDILRQYTIYFLNSVVKDRQKTFYVYDPACSTGKFLTTIKRYFKNAHTIGQELSKSMVEYAKNSGGVDEVYHGNAIVPAVAEKKHGFCFLSLFECRSRLSCAGKGSVFSSI
jgi:hypothetical protein